MSHVPNYTTSYSQFPRGKSPNSITIGQCFWQWVMQRMTSMGSSSALTVSSAISRIIQSLCATRVVPAGASNSSCQGRIKGGGTLSKCQGPRAIRGPADFLGLAVVYGPMFFGTTLHGFGRTYHILYVAGHWGTTF